MLAIAHLTDELPANRALVAIQPEEIDWGHCLSNPVKRALPEAGRCINELIREWSPGNAAALDALQQPDGHPQQLSVTPA